MMMTFAWALALLAASSPLEAGATPAAVTPRVALPSLPRGPLQSLISPRDYPPSAFHAREQGRVTFRLDVHSNGRVQSCTVTRSSGSAALDSATCRIMRSRARFTPASDAHGNPAPQSVTDSVVWRLPATAPSTEEVIVYTGQRDPRYAIPQRFRPKLSEIERRRLEAIRFQSYAEPVLARVATDPNFGGVVLRHEPEPHALVMFTGNAEERLAQYTRDPRFRAKRVDLTLAELERQKDDMSRQLHGLGLRCFSVDGDEERNQVTVTTPELDKVRSAIAQRLLRLPPKFAFLPGECPRTF